MAEDVPYVPEIEYSFLLRGEGESMFMISPGGTYA
jgi:hypothetical protein